MDQLQLQLQSIPGYGMAVDALNDYAGDHFNNTDPFEDDDGHRRRLDRTIATEDERRLWKRIQRQAWTHDRCFLGLCGIGLDCGIGLVPVAVFFVPVLGPLMMYVVHARLIHMAQSGMVLPLDLVAKMQLNIVFDLLISLPPVVGGFFTWLNGCLTRNAGMLFNYMEKRAHERETGPRYIGTRQNPLYPNDPGRSKTDRSKTDKNYKSRSLYPNEIHVGAQQSGVR